MTGRTRRLRFDLVDEPTARYFRVDRPGVGAGLGGLLPGRGDGHPSPPACCAPATAAVRSVDPDEVSHIGVQVARNRGYHEFRIEEIEREDDLRWEVEIAGWLGRERGELGIVVDGWDGRVLRVKDKRRRHEHHHDDEDDD